jgi:glycosyltransferase involved in cell wall biosynthesis
MRILFISHSSPLKEGGAETRTREVAFRLVKLGHQVTMFCGKTAVDDPDVQEVNGVKIITKQTLTTRMLKKYPYPHYFSLAAANLFLMVHIFRFLKTEKFDLIREDMAPFPPSFLLSLMRFPEAHRIAVVHNLPKRLSGWVKFYGRIFGFAGFVMSRLLRAGMLKYDRIICAAKWFADELKESPEIADRVRYVPNGVALEKFHNAGQGLANGKIRLLSVGRLVETKGHRYLIEALSYLKETPAVKLDILGNDPLKEPLMQLAKHLKVDDRIEFRAPVSYEKMPDLFNNYDYFVMPSLWEGFPVSLIEAMASKLPVIGTTISAITAVLDDDSAIFASQEDAQDLAKKLQWAFEHRGEALRRAEKAYEIAQRYDWDLTARQEIEGV